MTEYERIVKMLDEEIESTKVEQRIIKFLQYTNKVKKPYLQLLAEYYYKKYGGVSDSNSDMPGE